MSKNRIGTSRLSRHGMRIGALAAIALWVIVRPAAGAVVVQVSTSEALPGGVLTLQMRVDRAAGDPGIAGLQADLILSTEQLQLVGACSSDQSACEDGTACPDQGNCLASCELDSRLEAHSLAASFPDFQNVPTGQRRLRLPVNPEFPPSALSDGILVTCTFPVLPGAALGIVNLAADETRFLVTDENSDPVAATLQLAPGAIVSVLSTPTPTITETPVEPTLTATVETPTEDTPTVTPTVEEATATATIPTETPIVENTATPTQDSTATETGTIDATNTPTVQGSATPTRTNAAPTTTPTEATPTVGSEPTATHTSTGAGPTATAASPSATPTGGQQGGSSGDDDGCAMSAQDPIRGSGWAALILPFVMILVRRRKSQG